MEFYLVKGVINKMRLTKEEKGDFRIILEEYLDTFKKSKKHQKAHKKEPCYRCNFVKRILRKLK